jgi:hypothetical protein
MESEVESNLEKKKKKDEEEELKVLKKEDSTIISDLTQSIYNCMIYLKLLDSQEDFKKLRLIVALRPDKLNEFE